MGDVHSLDGDDAEHAAVTLDDLAREGARRMIAAALEVEVEEYVDSLVDELVSFDCDGVLVDSDRISLRIQAGRISALRLEMSYEECVREFPRLGYAGDAAYGSAGSVKLLLDANFSPRCTALAFRAKERWPLTVTDRPCRSKLARIGARHGHSGRVLCWAPRWR